MKYRLAILLLLATALPAAASRFFNLGAAEGLSNRKVYQVCQDADGYIWFYTQSSIDRYDGFEFKHYQLEAATDGRYLATANTLALDGEGILHVVQTNGRIYRYRKESDALELCISIPDVYLYSLLWQGDTPLLGTSDGLRKADGSVLCETGSSIRCMAQEGKRLYLGTDAGVFLYEDGHSRRLDGMPAVQITALHTLPDGRLLVGTFTDGAFLFSLSAGRAMALPVPHVPVRKILQDGDRLLFGTDGAGIVVCSLSSGAVTERYEYDDAGNGLCANTVGDICLDRNGALWVATTTDGVCFLDERRLSVDWIRHIPDVANSLPSNHVNTILEDRSGRLWFGTNKGLCRLDNGRWHTFRTPEEAKVVLSLAEDGNGNIWVGGYGHPVFSVDRQDRVHILDPQRFLYTFSLAVKDDCLWIGGLEDPLTRIRLGSGEEQSFPELNIWDIFPGTDVWIASPLGLGRIGAETDSVRWTSLPEKVSGAWCITRDCGGDLWFGAEQGGILRYRPRDDSFRHYPLKETVFGILCDRNDVIWAISGEKVFRLDPSTGEPVIINRFLDIESGEFNHTASTRLRDGRLALGTANGVLLFHPERLDDRDMEPVLPHLTDFHLLSGDTKRVLKGRAVDQLEAITLPAHDPSFSLSVSALELSRQARVRFSYQLVGYDSYPHTQLSAGKVEYRDMDSGHYRFLVKTEDAFTGKVLGEHSLRITILRPWWRTNLALFIYLLLASLAVVALVQYRRRKLFLKMTQERLDTFTHFAHELKTPVSLIVAPLMQLNKEAALDSQDKESVSMALRNADRLMDMINSLLDLRSKSDVNKRLQLEMTDLQEYLAEVTERFLPLAQKRGIRLSCTVADGLERIPLDREKMDHILQNLISNAVKYTEKGSVTVSATPLARTWKLTVTDTGIGIPASIRSRIFYGGVRAANARNVDETGYGIGLMITRQLVLQHYGTISLESKEGAGTSFTLLFPQEYRASQGSLVSGDTSGDIPEITTAASERARVLVVEDDAEMQRFLKELLTKTYDVQATSDGDAACKIAEESQPNLILADVVMPGMNGFELCRKIKSSLGTSHIPVILLTAMDDREHVIMGLEAGADDYILKPFDPQVLQVRISNLLHERERLRQLVLRSGREAKQREYTNRLDKEFMEKVLSLVEESYSDPEFQINDLCRSMAMSRTAFFNKLKALSGTGPNDFIRIYRLDKAKELLESGQFTVSEVADRVGFSDAKYFSSCFKRAFGVTPSKY